MFSILVKKELIAILQNPKFITTFTVSSFLIILSVLIGINEYKTNLAQYYTGISLAKSTIEESRSWHSINAIAYRKPDPMQIFVSGVNNDIGRFSNVSRRGEVKLQNSSYSDDPVFAIFRNIDFAFIITIVLSLFAIMFTYNAVNGEKEDGTLRLVFSNSISRAEFIASKVAGSWLGLVIPLLIPIAISFLLVILFDVDFRFFDWSRVLTFAFVSIIYFTFFIIFGILISSITKNSSTSFLLLLTFWIITVFIVPRVGVIAAGQIIKIPSEAEIESQLDAFSKDSWKNYTTQLSKMWGDRRLQMEGMTESEREMYEDDNSWGWMQKDDKLRKINEENITNYSRKLFEGYKNNRIELRKLALTLSRFSPASAYQLAAMNMASTDIAEKDRYEDAIQLYKEKFLTHATKKAETDGDSFGLRISMDSETGISVEGGRDQNKLDTSELPQFAEPSYTFAQIFEPTIIDISILFILSIACFGLSVYRFSKYDLR
jgi:ABC-2 type transport system permease protein